MSATEVRWFAFDLARIFAAIALISVSVSGDPGSSLAVGLGTFVITGLVVSLALRPSRGDT